MQHHIKDEANEKKEKEGGNSIAKGFEHSRGFRRVGINNPPWRHQEDQKRNDSCNTVERINSKLIVHRADGDSEPRPTRGMLGKEVEDSCAWIELPLHPTERVHHILRNKNKKKLINRR